MQKAQRVWPSAVRHHFRHQRNTDGEFTADSEASDEAVEREIPEPDRERTQPGAKRINQNGPHHRFDPPDPIAEDSEGQAAGGPADQEDRGGITAVKGDFLARLQQRLHGRDAGQVEKLLVHRVEQPA